MPRKKKKRKAPKRRAPKKRSPKKRAPKRKQPKPKAPKKPSPRRSRRAPAGALEEAPAPRLAPARTRARRYYEDEDFEPYDLEFNVTYEELFG